MESLVTMSDIARIASVTRQAVTNWRSRTASIPFPSPKSVVANVEHFDRDEVIDWLEATGRGLNASARLDAPAVAVPAGLAVEDAAVLLALAEADLDGQLGAVADQDLGGIGAGGERELDGVLRDRLELADLGGGDRGGRAALVGVGLPDHALCPWRRGQPGALAAAARAKPAAWSPGTRQPAVA